MTKRVQRWLAQNRTLGTILAVLVVALLLLAVVFWPGASDDVSLTEAESGTASAETSEAASATASTVDGDVEATAASTVKASTTGATLGTASSAEERILALLQDGGLIDAAFQNALHGEGTQASVAFVDNNTCTECHVDQAAQWSESHHAQAMQPANETTMLGDFDDVEFTDFDVTSRFFKEGDAYMVHTQGEDGEYADFQVAYTFGVEPLQQYLLAFPDGRYQALTVAWDTENEQWFNLYPNEEIAFDDELHWTDRHFAWNSSCAECHSTDLKLNYDLATTSYETDWAEMNVSCQSCHGPGETHVAWAEEEKQAEDSADYTTAGDIGAEDIGLLVDYRSMDAPTQVESCARCHSRRYPISLDDQQAQPLLDHFMPELLREEMYHADGQILEEVYVYGSYVQSKMYQEGVSCTNCHNVHTGELRQPGNELCTACHQLNPPTPTFPSLTNRIYDTPEHHFHAADSAGAQCVNCHMPAQNYMVVDPRRDHSLRIPRPDLSVTLGTPNACTQCHTDQEPEWAVAAMNEWIGEEWQRPHYGEVLAAGRAGTADSPSRLSSLASNTDQPEIVRATALDLLSGYGDAGVETLLAALDAALPLLRVEAAQGIGNLSLPPEEKLTYLAPLLTDPIRAVRIEAANALVTVPTMLFDAAQLAAFDGALLEYVAAQIAQPDHPEGFANLGTLFARQGDLRQAEIAYQSAIDRDEHFYEAHNNLARLYYQQGNQEKAEAVFRQALVTGPDEGHLHYSLALLLVEQARVDEGIIHFDQAAALLPDEPRVQYNYGLLLEQASRYTDALAAMQRAYELLPNDPDILYGLITFHMKAAEWDEATFYAEQLTQLFPSVPEFQQLLASLRDRS